MTGLALLCLLGQLWTVVHLSVVQHVTCEHGELIELSPGTGTQASDESISAQAFGAEPSDCHDHCLLNASRRDGPLVSRATALVTRLVLALPDLATRAAPLPSIPLILAAPKASPPV